MSTSNALGTRIDQEVSKRLVAVAQELGTGAITAAQIGMVAKAALQDFACGATSVQALREVSRLLGVATKARAIEIIENNTELSAQRLPAFY